MTKKQQPEQTYKSRVWFVTLDIRYLAYSFVHNREIWVLNESTRITPERATSEDAAQDFRQLGFKSHLYYHKEKNNGEMKEYMVQCHTEY